MAADLPYLISYKNVGALFERITNAKAPEAFTTAYLANTLGLKSTTDRAFISLLKALGFLDASGKPAPQYMSLKNPALAKSAIAAGVKRAYAPLFAANEKTNELDAPALKGLIAQVTGADVTVVAKILGTLQALLKQSDFASVSAGEQATDEPSEAAATTGNGDTEAKTSDLPLLRSGQLRPEFHYNIQVHLPANATEETYLHIFNAMRKAFV